MYKVASGYYLKNRLSNFKQNITSVETNSRWSSL
jgi:hypothetical protein